MEYLILIFEFFYTKKLRSLFTLLIMPFGLGMFMHQIINRQFLEDHNSAIESNIVTLLGILLGFTISFFAILITSNSSNIKKAKNKKIEKSLFKREISIYDVMITGVAYGIILQCTLLIVNLTFPLVIEKTESQITFLAINIGLLIHIVLVLLRSVLDFYFSFTKIEKEESSQNSNQIK